MLKSYGWGGVGCGAVLANDVLETPQVLGFDLGLDLGLVLLNSL